MMHFKVLLTLNASPLVCWRWHIMQKKYVSYMKLQPHHCVAHICFRNLKFDYEYANLLDWFSIMKKTPITSHTPQCLRWLVKCHYWTNTWTSSLIYMSIFSMFMLSNIEITWVCFVEAISPINLKQMDSSPSILEFLVFA